MKKEINELIVDIENHILKIKSFSKEIEKNELSSRLITYSIVAGMILFFFGVIYPLHFLPLPQEYQLNISFSVPSIWSVVWSLKGAILALIFIIFSGIMIRFLIININLKHSDETKNELQKYPNFGYYSPYLKGLDENR